MLRNNSGDFRLARRKSRIHGNREFLRLQLQIGPKTVALIICSIWTDVTDRFFIGQIKLHSCVHISGMMSR